MEPLLAAMPPIMTAFTEACWGDAGDGASVGDFPDVSDASFCRAILSFNVSLPILLLERGRASSALAASGVAMEEVGVLDGDEAASSASRFARAIFSFNVSLPALLSDLARIGESASKDADAGVEGAAAAKSASLFCRAIFSLRVSLPELFSALPELCSVTDEDIGGEAAAERGASRPEGGTLQEYLDGLERQAILDALENTRFNRTAAAKRLGITFRALRYRMARLGIQ